MIGMVGNHLLVKIYWSDHVLKKSNSCDLRPAVGYFQTKRNHLISYMGMKLLLNSINKGSEICPIYQMTVTNNNTRSFSQQLLHTIFKNQMFHVVRNLDSCEFWQIKQWKWSQTLIQQQIWWENDIFDEYRIIKFKWN